MDREHEYMTRGMADELAESVVDDAIRGAVDVHAVESVNAVADTLYELAAAIEEGRLADWWNGR